MHMRDRGSAQVMRRASAGPHALMRGQAVAPYVPDRGLGFYLPARSRRQTFGSLGAGAVVGQTVTGVKAGITASTVSTGVAAGVASAIGAGAAAGSVVPIIGTAIGAIVGLIASGVFSHRKAAEDANFQQAMAIARQNLTAVLDIQNKYLVLAGLFDLEPGQIKGNIPIYKKYGRMGEYKFVTDLCHLIYNAAQQGQITANDTPQSVFNRIVQPWINSFGFGAMQDSNTNMINMILLGMTAEYIMGQYTNWYAIGGQYPFGSLTPFALPGAVAPTASATPSPTYTQPQPGPVLSPQPVPTQQVATPTELQTYLAGGMPASGATLGYARDNTTGQFMALPAGGTYAGTTAQGSWIVQYSTGQYTLKNGVLTPYSTTQTPAPSSAVVPTVDTSIQTPISQQPQQPVYVPSGGGGSGYTYNPPPMTAAPTQTASLLGGLSMQTVLLAGGAIFALSLLLPHNRASVRAAGKRS